MCKGIERITPIGVITLKASRCSWLCVNSMISGTDFSVAKRCGGNWIRFGLIKFGRVRLDWSVWFRGYVLTVYGAGFSPRKVTILSTNRISAVFRRYVRGRKNSGDLETPKKISWFFVLLNTVNTSLRRSNFSTSPKPTRIPAEQNHRPRSYRRGVNAT